MESIVGCVVTVDCGERGSYQGVIKSLSIDGPQERHSIVLDKPFRDGVPFGQAPIPLRLVDVKDIKVLRRPQRPVVQPPVQPQSKPSGRVQPLERAANHRPARRPISSDDEDDDSSLSEGREKSKKKSASSAVQSSHHQNPPKQPLAAPRHARADWTESDDGYGAQNRRTNLPGPCGIPAEDERCGYASSNSLRQRKAMQKGGEQQRQHRRQRENASAADDYQTFGALHESDLDDDYDFDANNRIFDRQTKKDEASNAYGASGEATKVSRNFRHDENIVTDPRRVTSWTKVTNTAAATKTEEKPVTINPNRTTQPVGALTESELLAKLMAPPQKSAQPTAQSAVLSTPGRVDLLALFGGGGGSGSDGGNNKETVPVQVPAVQQKQLTKLQLQEAVPLSRLESGGGDGDDADNGADPQQPRFQTLRSLRLKDDAEAPLLSGPEKVATLFESSGARYLKEAESWLGGGAFNIVVADRIFAYVARHLIRASPDGAKQHIAVAAPWHVARRLAHSLTARQVNTNVHVWLIVEPDHSDRTLAATKASTLCPSAEELLERHGVHPSVWILAGRAGNSAWPTVQAHLEVDARCAVVGVERAAAHMLQVPTRQRHIVWLGCASDDATSAELTGHGATAVVADLGTPSVWITPPQLRPIWPAHEFLAYL